MLYGLNGIRMYSKVVKKRAERRTNYRAGNLFYSHAEERNNKTALGVFPDFPSELCSVLVSTARKGECRVPRFHHDKDTEPSGSDGPASAGEQAKAKPAAAKGPAEMQPPKANAEICKIQDILGDVTYNASTGVVKFLAAVQGVGDVDGAAPPQNVYLELCLTKLHVFLDGFSPTRQFHRTEAVYRLIDEHRYRPSPCLPATVAFLAPCTCLLPATVQVGMLAPSHARRPTSRPAIQHAGPACRPHGR